MVKKNIKTIIEIILIVVLFVSASYIVQNNIDFFKNFIKDNVWSMILYVLLLIVSAVIAPVDMIFLMPLASSVWGLFLTAILSLMGWTLGSAVVFILCRKYGVDLIKRFVPLEKIYKYENLMPQENIFAEIILLRLIIPIDKHY